MIDAQINIIDVFERALETPFEAKFIERIDYHTIRKLAKSLQDYYHNFKIPEKLRGELRPHVFSRFTTSSALNSAFWMSRDTTNTPNISNEVKKYLLYSHGVSFEDGLIYMLDYFRLSSQETDETRKATPMVKHLLAQYAEISELLRNNIVILTANEMFPLYNTPLLSQEEADDIRKNAFNWVNRKRLDPNVLGGIVKEQLILCELSKNNLDLYFPHKIYIPILESIWRTLGKKYSSQMVLEPYRAGIIGKFENMDTKKLSVRDLVIIRQEGVFEEFRGFIRRTFEKIDRSERFSDFELEFGAELRQELMDNSERVKKLTKRSNVIRDIWGNADKVIIGAGLGALPGAYAGSPWLTIAGAAIGGGVKPVLESLTASAKAPPSSNARTSVRNHFLALQSGSR